MLVTDQTVRRNSHEEAFIPNILITGAAGFIGRSLAKAYGQMGWYVVGIDPAPIAEDPLTLGFKEYYPTKVEPNSLQRITVSLDAVLLCSGAATVQSSFAQPSQSFEASVVAVSHVLDFVRTRKLGSKIILFSSAALYGNGSNGYLKESADAKPISVYGCHKQMAELTCKVYAAFYGLDIAIVRLFSVYGQGMQKQLLWEASSRIAAGNFNFYGTGEEVRDWIHIDDIVRFIALLLPHASKECPVFNCGTGRGCKIRDVLSMICKEMRSDKKCLSFSLGTRVEDPWGMVADISLARSFGWQPTITVEAGIADYVQWFVDGKLKAAG